MIFFRRAKKDSEFETEVIQRLESIQKADARLRQDLPEIIHDTIIEILEKRERRAIFT